MNKLVCLLMIGAIAAASFDVHAQGDAGYFGLRVGPMKFDSDRYEEPTNLGLVGGYIGDNGLGFEAELTATVSDGSISTVVPISGGYTSRTSDINIYTLGIYNAIRSPGDAYIKSKFGIVFESKNIGRSSVINTNASLGLGIGINTRAGILEIEYTIIEEGVNFLSIGFLF